MIITKIHTLGIEKKEEHFEVWLEEAHAFV